MKRPSVARCLCVTGVFVFCLGLLSPSPLLAAAPHRPGQTLRAQTAPAQPNAAPDLQIEQITVNPPNPGAGSTADITVVVKNQGDAPAGGFHLYLYVEPVDDPPTLSTPFTTQTFDGAGLPAGDTFTWTRTGQLFTQNNPKIYAWVDRDNQVAESDETNNLFPLPTQAPQPDVYEQGAGDDDCLHANAIATDGKAQDHNLFRQDDQPDIDWVEFSAKSGITYVAEVRPSGKDAQLLIELHPACDGPPGLASGVAITFTAPTNSLYYLKIRHDENNYGPDNAYQLQVTGDDNCSAVYEPNNQCSLPTDIAVNGGGQTHTFCETNDIDWFRFDVAAGAQYTVTATNAGNRADVQMTLFTSCEGAGEQKGQTLSYSAPTAGFVYLKTQNLDPKVHGPGTEYTVEVQADNPAHCQEDALEPDDTRATAQPLDPHQQTHTICPAADEDWAKFNAVAGTTYAIETLNLKQNSDTLLCLYAANTDKIACDDDNGAGQGSRLIWTAPTSATFYIQVKATNPHAVGPDTQYDLRVTTGICQSDAAEPDNSQGSAHSVPTDNSAQLHNFCAGNDEDWVTFTATAQTTYVIATSDPGPEADTIIELYAADGQQLARNDDYSPNTDSQLVYTFATAGVYAVRVAAYNPTHFGTGTEYAIHIRQGTPTVTPTATPVENLIATPTPAPQASGIHTLILFNRTRTAALYSADEAAQLANKLTALANDSQVQGEIVALDQNTEVNAAYATWLADWTNSEKANGVAAAIRRVVMTYLQQHDSIEYVVLVGDDRTLPFRRIADQTDQLPENTYQDVDADNPTGAALLANNYLSDDYYVDRAPTALAGHELYLPDLAVGRLVETPGDMIRLIDAFLARPVTPADKILISGYTFVEDVATQICHDWQRDLNTTIDCNSLIGNGWTGQDLRSGQVHSNPTFKIQSINGHAAHFAEGEPQIMDNIYAQQIADANVDLSGGLIYTPGCHAGLNVPPTSKTGALDLVQAFSSKGANYVGNTGYGWGDLTAIEQSEKVVLLYTRALLAGTRASMGKALVSAKHQYYSQVGQAATPYDEKVLQQMTFYGLPMFQVQTPTALAPPPDDFPGVNFTPQLPSGSLGIDDVLTGTVKLDVSAAQNLNTVDVTGAGQYYALNGHVAALAGQPVQPLHFGDITVAQKPVRSAVVLGGSYTTQANFDPVIASPYNEYVTAPHEKTLADALGLYPAVPVTAESHNGQSTLITQVGQYDAAKRELHLYNKFQVDVYYSTSLDQVAPDVTVVDGIHYAGTTSVEVKVGAQDASGIQRVVVAYIKDSNQATNSLQSLDLTFNPSAQKWMGAFSGDTNSRFFVQVVDKAGNMRSATNKDRYYTPGLVEGRSGSACTNRCIFLPLIRQNK